MKKQFCLGLVLFLIATCLPLFALADNTSSGRSGVTQSIPLPNTPVPDALSSDMSYYDESTGTGTSNITENTSSAASSDIAISSDTRVIDLSDGTTSSGTPDVTAQSAIDNLSFAFSPDAIGQMNGASLSSYEKVYGEKTLLAESIYDRIANFDPGSSYGMVAAAAILHEQGFQIEGQANQTQNPFHEPSVLETNSQIILNGTASTTPINIKEFIEIMQASQGSIDFSREFAQNGTVDAVQKAVSAYQSTGKECPVICVWKPGRIHALLGYRLETKDDENRIYVYDSDRPMDGNKYISVKRNEQGLYSWTYSTGDSDEWNSQVNSRLSYIPYSVLIADWNQHSHEADGKRLLLTTNSESVQICDVDDRIMAEYIEGNAKSAERKNVYRAFDWFASQEGTREISVWIPAGNVYTVINYGGAGTDFKASLINIRQGITASTDGKILILSVDDNSTSAFAQVIGEEKHYQVDMICRPAINPDYERVEFAGHTKSNYPLTASLYNGYLVLYGENGIETLKINGEDKNPADYAGKEFEVVGASEQTVSFEDVSERSYYYQPVQWAVSHSITVGTSKTTFSPDEHCTRAHILTFLWRAFGSPEPKDEFAFSDVKEEDYFASSSKWAHDMGLVTGVTFEGAKPCTRLEAIMYFWKLNNSPVTEGKPFDDVPANSEASNAVMWAVEQNITNGKTQHTFAPNDTCTRAQIVTFLYRYFRSMNS